MKYEEIFYEDTAQLTGNQLINKLDSLSKDKYVYFTKPNESYHKFNAYPVNCFHSWRGSYNLPSISSCGEDTYTNTQLIDKLNTFFGSVQIGWKGGEYIMYAEDKLWCDDEGSCREQGIKSVVETEEGIFIIVDQFNY